MTRQCDEQRRDRDTGQHDIQRQIGIHRPTRRRRRWLFFQCLDAFVVRVELTTDAFEDDRRGLSLPTDVAQLAGHIGAPVALPDGATHARGSRASSHIRHRPRAPLLWWWLSWWLSWSLSWSLSCRGGGGGRHAATGRPQRRKSARISRACSPRVVANSPEPCGVSSASSAAVNAMLNDSLAPQVGQVTVSGAAAVAPLPP